MDTLDFIYILSFRFQILLGKYYIDSNPISPFPEVLNMTESVYKIIELVGSSETSWEDAVKNAVEAASKSLRDLRICEVMKLDTKIENGQIVAYRARVQLSFKYEV
jgi:flavin-binding protein dodecin